MSKYLKIDSELREVFEQGSLIAYPTEAVFGLGCDPLNAKAIQALLALKQRPKEKGLILVAGNYELVRPFINESAIPDNRKEEIFSSWPGPVTWLLPKSQLASDWLTGGSELIAVRVSSHSLVNQMTEFLNSPVVSTSANLTGQEPARESNELEQQFADSIYILDGELGGNLTPSEIKHGITGQVLRAAG